MTDNKTTEAETTVLKTPESMKTSTTPADQGDTKLPELPATPSIMTGPEAEYNFGQLKTRYTYDVQDARDKYKVVIQLSVICDDINNLEAKLMHVIKQNLIDSSRYLCLLKLIEVLE